MTYSFGYDGNGKLSSITAPPINGTQRITSVTVTSGKLASIRNAGDSLVSFSYLPLAPHQYLMDQRINRRNIPTTFTYDSALNVRTSLINPVFAGGPITLTVTAGESRGLPKSGTPSSVDTLKVYTKIDGPRGTLADSTIIFQENFGSPRRSIDARGAITRMKRNYLDDWYSAPDLGWVLHRLKRPLGQVVIYRYETPRGNLTHVIDSTGTSPG